MHAVPVHSCTLLSGHRETKIKASCYELISIQLHLFVQALCHDELMAWVLHQWHASAGAGAERLDCSMCHFMASDTKPKAAPLDAGCSSEAASPEAMGGGSVNATLGGTTRGAVAGSAACGHIWTPRCPRWAHGAGAGAPEMKPKAEPGTGTPGRLPLALPAAAGVQRPLAVDAKDAAWRPPQTSAFAPGAGAACSSICGSGVTA